MTIRYRMPLFAQTISVGSGRLDAAPDGWFYPRTAEEEAGLVSAGCVPDDLSSGEGPRPVTTETPEYRSLVSGAMNQISAVTYDGSNRCTGYTSNDVTYTITGWGTSTVTITGSDLSVRTVTLDGSGRIVGVV